MFVRVSAERQGRAGPRCLPGTLRLREKVYSRVRLGWVGISISPHVIGKGGAEVGKIGMWMGGLERGEERERRSQ